MYLSNHNMFKKNACLKFKGILLSPLPPLWQRLLLPQFRNSCVSNLKVANMQKYTYYVCRNNIRPTLSIETDFKVVLQKNNLIFSHSQKSIKVRLKVFFIRSLIFWQCLLFSLFFDSMLMTVWLNYLRNVATVL